MQQIPNYLNARQKLFCHWFALTRDAQGAADRCFRAPEKREEALLLLQTPLAQDYLRQVEAALGGEGLTATAEEGYRRLAFGPVTDAVRLMFPTEDETPPLEEMDLYNISKISQAKGGLEITFFDRLEALDRLEPRERHIISLRFGLDGAREQTQKEVADRLGISQSYISRLEKRIIARLKKEIVRMM